MWGSLTAALVMTILVPMVLGTGGEASAQGPQVPQVFEAAGDSPVDIQPTVDAFRNALGTDNASGPPAASGRREINWDGVPDNFSAPNELPPNFFNVNVPRGVVFFTPGVGFQVSADNDNPTRTPVEFENLAPGLSRIFRTFSPQRLFTALESPTVEILFFVPGTRTQATTTGFGAVFTDVNLLGTTKIEYFDINGALLFSRVVRNAPDRDETLSFLGVVFRDPGVQVYLVRITSGTVPFANRPGTNAPVVDGADDGRRDAGVRDAGEASVEIVDRVVMDDFIYGEPRRLP